MQPLMNLMLPITCTLKSSKAHDPIIHLISLECFISLVSLLTFF